MTTTIVLQNASTVPLPRPDVLEMIAAAIDLQVRRDFAPDYGLDPNAWQVVAAPVAGPRYIVARIIDDDPSAPGALAYHDDPTDPAIVILAKTILAAGGDWYDSNVSISGAISHEVLELIGDPACNRWAQAADGTLYAIEVCDPVEETGYTVQVGHSGSGEESAVAVSNYVLPAWFDPTLSAVPVPIIRFDRLGQTHAPLTLAAGGYAIVEKANGERQITGDMPPWKLNARIDNPYARTTRRVRI